MSETSESETSYENKKFYCEKCNFSTDFKYTYNEHLQTILHQTGKRKVRCDKNKPKKTYVCNQCNFFDTVNKINYQTHMLNNHSTLEERKNGFTFYCSFCDFGTFDQLVMIKHEESKKHQKRSCKV